MEKINLDLTPETTLAEMLEQFPNVENKLIDLIPAFQTLKNPGLRNTIAKVTTLKQAASIGQIPLGELVNALRREADLEEFKINDSITLEDSLKPDWLIEEKIVTTYDAIEDIANGLHPVGKVITAAESLTEGKIYLLITNFVPAPLIKKGEDMGLKVFNTQIADKKFGTYFCK
ncbi:MAG: DUF1858 domain-containing protein [bacterium]